MNRAWRSLLGTLIVVIALVLVSSCATEQATGQKAAAAPQKQPESEGLPKGMELYEHKDPHFTIMVPKTWSKSNESRNPDCVLRKATGAFGVPSFEISVYDLQEEVVYTELADEMIEFLEDEWGGSDFMKLYERNAKLKDGTPAYEFEVRGDYSGFISYTYQLYVFKEKRAVGISITEENEVSDKLKGMAYSLTFK